MSSAIAQKFFGVTTEGEVISFNKQSDGSYVMKYTYYNEFNDKDYNMSVDIRKSFYPEVKDRKTVLVEYSGLFPKHAIALGVEAQPPLILLVIGNLLVLVALFRALQVVSGKSSVEEFFGVRGEKRTDN